MRLFVYEYTCATSANTGSLGSEGRAMLLALVRDLVRVHGGYFDEDGEVDPAKVKHAIEIVEAMKAEGIYTHFSIYFPLWFRPKPDHPYSSSPGLSRESQGSFTGMAGTKSGHDE